MTREEQMKLLLTAITAAKVDDHTTYHAYIVRELADQHRYIVDGSLKELGI